MDTLDREVFAAFLDAFRVSDTSRLVALLDAHPESLTLFNYGGDSLVHMAAENNDVEFLDLLFAKGADPDEGMVLSGQTPLTIALRAGSVQAVERLLQQGADPNYDRTMISAINSKRGNSLELVRLLVAYGVDVHKLFTFGPRGTPLVNALSWAILNEKHDVAEFLRQQGARLPDESATSPPKTQEQCIVEFFRDTYGPVDPRAIREIVPSGPPVAVHVVKPSKQSQCVTLFTTGMSEHRIVGGANQVYEFAELFMQLPSDWPLSDVAVADPRSGWPIHWLQNIAKYASVDGSRFGGPYTVIANEDPPQPLAPNTEMTSLLLLREKECVCQGGRAVSLLRVFPLYSEERQLELSKGIGALMRKFDAEDIEFVVDVKRPNVAT